MLWTFIVVVLLSIPTSSLGASELMEWDKAAHLGLFFVLTWLWLHAVADRSQVKAFLVALLACAFAFLSEWYQHLLPFRGMDILDAIADSAGALLAWLVWWLEVRRH